MYVYYQEWEKRDISLHPPPPHTHTFNVAASIQRIGRERGEYPPILHNIHTLPLLHLCKQEYLYTYTCNIRPVDTRIIQPFLLLSRHSVQLRRVKYIIQTDLQLAISIPFKVHVCEAISLLAVHSTTTAVPSSLTAVSQLASNGAANNNA